MGRYLWLIPAAALLAGLGWYENKDLRVTGYALESSRLPAAFHGFRVVQLSDLHGAQFGRDNRRLLEAVAALDPDLIALTGDLADTEAEVRALPAFLRALTAIAPACYVTGNHEWRLSREARRELFGLLAACGVTRLENEHLALTRDGQTIALAGVDDPNGPADQKTPRQVVEAVRQKLGEEVYILMLAHRNDQLSTWAALEVDTVLTGHAHGGIWDLPLVGPVFGTHLDLLPDDAEGVYEQGRTKMVVSRGLGQSKKIPFRLGNRPEITVVELGQP